jgi:phosphoribosylformimino-5-aminoimidazole carboxamide ribotide isomerase
VIPIPAIDLKDGRAVRLYEGRLGTERVVADSPVEQALAFARAGAQRLHVVDLDGAFEGRPRNEEVLRAIVQAVSIPVQFGGGLRTVAGVDAVFEIGVRFAILGTMLVEEPAVFESLCRRYPGQIIAGIDALKGQVMTKGWVEGSGKTVVEMARKAESAGACAIITTDVARDGTGQGVNVAGTDSLARLVNIPVIASGGVSSLDDLRSLRQTGVAGVIIGRALYDGAFRLEDALEAS